MDLLTIILVGIIYITSQLPFIVGAVFIVKVLIKLIFNKNSRPNTSLQLIFIFIILSLLTTYVIWLLYWNPMNQNNLNLCPSLPEYTPSPSYNKVESAPSIWQSLLLIHPVCDGIITFFDILIQYYQVIILPFTITFLLLLFSKRLPKAFNFTLSKIAVCTIISVTFVILNMTLELNSSYQPPIQGQYSAVFIPFLLCYFFLSIFKIPI